MLIIDRLSRIGVYQLVRCLGRIYCDPFVKSVFAESAIPEVGVSFLVDLFNKFILLYCFLCSTSKEVDFWKIYLYLLFS